MENKYIIDFYNDFVEMQQNTGINDRIYGLFRRLKDLGLRSDSNVLEFGCGIGTMTFLLSKTVKKGKIESVDISPESIQFCEKRLKKINTLFFTHDIVSYIPTLQKIDFITLFDVIEHIPIEKHHELFNNLYKICNDTTKILINIPNPEYINYDIEKNPEVLQIIDQPLPLNFILKNLENNNLNLLQFETYGIWVENDYQFLLISRKRKFKETRLSDKRNFFQKAAKKIERMYLKAKYNYR